MENINLYFLLPVLQSSEQMWGVAKEDFQTKLEYQVFLHLC